MFFVIPNIFRTDYTSTFRLFSLVRSSCTDPGSEILKGFYKHHSLLNGQLKSLKWKNKAASAALSVQTLKDLFS